MTFFYNIANLIRVQDICEPFYKEFQGTDSIDETWQTWSEDSFESDFDPMDKVSLIRHDSQVVGFITFDLLGLDENANNLLESMEPINGNMIMSADTPLMEALLILVKAQNHVYFVMKGNSLIGHLTYYDFSKLPFRLCLYALLLEIEKIMLDIVQLQPSLFLSNLPDGRLENAIKIYKYRGYSLNDKNKEFSPKLVECTTFIDKFTMLRKEFSVCERCPELKNKLYKTAEKLRNKIAHPDNMDSFNQLIDQEKLILFLQWSSELHEQLENYYSDKRNT